MTVGTVVRYGVGAVLSVAFNAGLVASLAELAQPAQRADDHASHQVRPSVVKPPPPPKPASSAPSPSADSPMPLPAAPPAPALDLPALADGPAVPGLTAAELGGVGLDGLDFSGGNRGLDDPAATPATTQPPQLTVPPDLARFYPERARRSRLEGRTIMAITVGVDGRTRTARVLRSDPPGVFDDAAVRAARSFRFAPAERGGQPVEATTRLELVWQSR